MGNKREEQVKKQAKQILEKFAKALEKVKHVPEEQIEREQDRRKEGEGQQPNEQFRKIFFENAPQTKDKCIQAEKGAWK